MLLEGEPLARYVRIGFDFIFGAGADEPALCFEVPAIPAQTPVPFTAEAHAERPCAIPLEVAHRDEHSNGAAQQ